MEVNHVYSNLIFCMQINGNGYRDITVNCKTTRNGQRDVTENNTINVVPTTKWREI